MQPVGTATFQVLMNLVNVFPTNVIQSSIPHFIPDSDFVRLESDKEI